MYSVFVILSVCVALHCSNIIGLQIGCLLLSGEYATQRKNQRERGHLYKQVLSIVHFSFN